MTTHPVDDYGRRDIELPAWAPRWLTDRPYSLEDTVRYALEGAFTAEDSGSPRRWGHLLWLVIVVVPVWSVAAMVIWATERPGRGLPIALIATATLTALNQWLAVEWLIPDWSTLPYWYAVITGWWAA